MSRSLPSLLAFLLPLAPLAAQWNDGDLIVRVVQSSGFCDFARIDPTTGQGQTFVTGAYPGGYSGAAVFDSWRDALLVNCSLPPDGYTVRKLWAIHGNGSATAISALGQIGVLGLCSAGDGRVFYQVYGGATPEIRWLDANDQPHTLMDATGTAPFQFAVEHMLYHPASNSLIASTSGWWSSHDCQPGACSVFRVPLSADGSRVAGAVQCASIASDNQEIMSMCFTIGGRVLLCLGNGSYPMPNLLQTFDPVTLQFTPFASPAMGNLDGAVYCTELGAAVVLDDGANVLRIYGAPTTPAGTVLTTNVAVSAPTSGYSPVENLWIVDKNGPACHGVGQQYGIGLAGTGGQVPTLGTVGCPAVAGTFSLALDHARGASFGMLALGGGAGSAPLVGGTLLVQPLLTTMSFLTGGAAGVGGAGTWTLPLHLTDPSWLGVSLWFQAGVLDASAAQGVALTNGLRVIFG